MKNLTIDPSKHNTGSASTPPPLSNPPTVEETRKFVMALIHALRNKLNSAHGYSELLWDTLMDVEHILDREDCAEMADVTKRNVEDALRVCDTYLERVLSLDT